MTPVRQRNVALILARELAVNIATPMWIWDEAGELVYANEHVQEILGSPHRDIGVGQLTDLPSFEPRDLDGSPLPMDELPSAVALRQKRPTHREMLIVGRDGGERRITVTAFPLFARGGEFVGAMSIFWDVTGLPTP